MEWGNWEAQPSQTNFPNSHFSNPARDSTRKPLSDNSSLYLAGVNMSLKKKAEGETRFSQTFTKPPNLRSRKEKETRFMRLGRIENQIILIINSTRLRAMLLPTSNLPLPVQERRPLRSSPVPCAFLTIYKSSAYHHHALSHPLSIKPPSIVLLIH